MPTHNDTIAYAMDTQKVRANFPALSQDQVFFDNAGGSQILGSVVDSDDAVLGASTTQLFRNFASTLNFQPGDEIVISAIDHEANIAPWVDLAKHQDLVLKWWKPASATAPKLLASELTPLLSERTRLVTCTHASNILGTIHDIKAIAAAAHAANPSALVCVDAVAYAPHRRIDVRALGVDVYAFSWYKVYGPHIAVLYAAAGSAQAQMRSLGHFFNPHATLENKLGLAGGSYELVSGISAVASYVDAVGWEAIVAQEAELQGTLLGYLNGRDDVTVRGETSADGTVRVPTVSFTVKGWDSRELVETVEKETRFGFRWGAFYSNRLVNEVLGLGKDGVVRGNIPDMGAGMVAVPRTQTGRDSRLTPTHHVPRKLFLSRVRRQLNRTQDITSHSSPNPSIVAMLPTPDTSHVSYSRVYEPAEDSFLLLNTLSSPSETAFLQQRFGSTTTTSPHSHDHRPPPPPPLVVEVGTGSGVVLGFVNAHALPIFGTRGVLTLGVDVNAFACSATAATAARAAADNPGTHGRFLGAVRGDLLAPLRAGSADVLVFNPPYVPTDELPAQDDVRLLGGAGNQGEGGEDEERSMSASARFDRDSYLLSLSYAGGRDGMEITDRLIAGLPDVLSARGCAYLLLCAGNKPEEVKARIRGFGPAWRVLTVGDSGKQAGWEKLQIIRIWRDADDDGGGRGGSDNDTGT
ncbi:hypothetical protein N8I77_003273 [Diaporthe amygdali]|uniref:Aminotransferase class V domain-containing protein n=1 Tax=Phomopsis amygdali TaxID=1214568 RepID=A0AAD9W5M3_PHOAM|nr:hypothetical protein N8I77_003273 [Diaporthe amygdali]